MAFTIQDNDESFASNPQSLIMQTDINALVAGIGYDGVISGCAVTAQGSPNMTVAVAAGLVQIAGGQVTVASGNVTITTADGTNPRIDLVVVNSSGTKSVTAGTAAANPKAPDIPASSVLLAMVYVPASDTTIASNQITDKRLIVPALRVYTPEQYGAFGNGTTDDTVALQAAIDAAAAVNGVVDGGGRSYLISRQASLTGDSLTTPYCLKVVETQGDVTIRNCRFKLADTQVANSIMLLMRGSSVTKRTNKTHIFNCAFDGNMANQVASWTDFGLVEVIYADYVTLENSYVHDSPYFLTQTFRNAQNCRWVGNRLVSSAAGHQTRFESPRMIIEGNVFEGVVGASAGGLLVLATNADINVTSAYCTVVGNTFVGGFQQCLLNAAERCTIIGNVFTSVTNTNATALVIAHYTGAVNYDSDENIVSGNTFYDIRNGVKLDSTTTYGAKRNHIVNNIISDGPSVVLSTGILESGASVDANLIADNRIIGASTAITKVGATTIVRDNVGFTSTQDSLQAGNNLSDLTNAGTARTNLGVPATSHTHAAADVTSGTMATARLGSGTADNTTFLRGDQTWTTPSGGGSVTSVAMTVPAELSVSGSPITTSGTLAVTKANQNANIVFAGPASGSAAAPTFRALVGADAPNRGQYVEYYDDFLLSLPNNTSISGAAAAVSGLASSIADVGGNPGWVAFQTGTATTGRALATGASSAILLGNGAWVFETLIYVPTVSDGTDTFVVTAGWNDSPTVTGVDAVMFRYTHGTNSGKFECITRANSTSTTTDSTITLVAATNYKLRIEINAAATSVVFYINGSSVATHTTNIPTGAGRATALQVGIVKSAGTTNRDLLCDYIYARCDLTAAR
jgi:hypothetical protein